MPNLIDKPQLQATAQVAKSYILDQDTANVNTIINALQQSGGGSGKQEGIITFTQTGFEAPEEPGQGSYATVTGTISYNGDGTIYSSATGSTVANGSELSYTMNAGGTRPYYVLYAKETDNFSAAVLTY